MKNMSIIDELKAIQSGKLPCSNDRLAICVTYCERRIKVMQDIMASAGPNDAIRPYLPGMQEKIDLFSGFISWAGTQTGGGK